MPIMQEMVDYTATLPGWDNFGWTRSGDRLIWRSAFDRADDMLMSFDELAPYINRLLAGPATMERVEFVSPSDQIAAIQKATASLANQMAALTQPEYFETIEDVQTGFFRKATASEGKGENTLCTMTPHYTISDWAAARPLMQGIVDKSSKEAGCNYFGWTKRGDTLHSLEAFVDGDALKAHVDNVRPLMDELQQGPAALERVEVHGPASELAKIKNAAKDPWGGGKVEYFETTQGRTALSMEGSEAQQAETKAATEKIAAEK